MKALAEILNPDVRQAALVTLDSGGWRPTEIRDYHKLLDAVRVTDAVPEAIRKQFEVARDLMLYGWFVYEFYTVASAQALSSLEFGLREACQIVNDGVNPCAQKSGLRCYIKEAKKRGLIPSEKYHEQLDLFLSSSRNDLAHGGETLFNYALAMPDLEIVAAILNHIFSSEAIVRSRQI